MAATEPLELCLSSTAFLKPPTSSRQRESNHSDREFKYRGTLFRPSPALHHGSQNGKKTKDFVHSRPALEGHGIESSVVNSPETCAHLNKDQKSQMKLRRIQSAKGRLERLQELDKCRLPPASSNVEQQIKSSDKKASVLNINAAVDIPDKEETELMLRANVVHKASNELNQRQRLRPSSAKSTFGSPVSNAEKVEQEHKPVDMVKPAVFGLKLGRQVFGNEPHIHEAWTNTQTDYPFKLKEQRGKDTPSTIETDALKIRNLPKTLKPLERWKRQSNHSDVTGLDFEKCIVFLSRDYTADELPMVPSPQDPKEDLPYTCEVATPRKEPQKKYHHPYFEHVAQDLEWKCRHTKAFDPDSHGDISFLLNPPYRCDPHEIRLEIAELENLMQGIGSLSSDCSFVKFQAEIRCARALARKLILPSSSSDTLEPTDSFGLLKFYKEHDKAMEVIHERRHLCLQELALIERGCEECPT